jgi:hypothetical protein
MLDEYCIYFGYPPIDSWIPLLMLVIGRALTYIPNRHRSQLEDKGNILSHVCLHGWQGTHTPPPKPNATSSPPQGSKRGGGWGALFSSLFNSDPRRMIVSKSVRPYDSCGPISCGNCLQSSFISWCPVSMGHRPFPKFNSTQLQASPFALTSIGSPDFKALGEECVCKSGQS